MFVVRQKLEKRQSGSHSAGSAERGRKGGIGGVGPKICEQQLASWRGKAPVRPCQCSRRCIWHLGARVSTDEQIAMPVVFRCPSKLSRTIGFNLLLTSTSSLRDGTLTRILIRSMLLFGQGAIFPKAYVIEVEWYFSSPVISPVKAPPYFIHVHLGANHLAHQAWPLPAVSSREKFLFGVLQVCRCPVCGTHCRCEEDKARYLCVFD